MNSGQWLIYQKRADGTKFFLAVQPTEERAAALKARMNESWLRGQGHEPFEACEIYHDECACMSCDRKVPSYVYGVDQCKRCDKLDEAFDG